MQNPGLPHLAGPDFILYKNIFWLLAKSPFRVNSGFTFYPDLHCALYAEINKADCVVSTLFCWPLPHPLAPALDLELTECEKDWRENPDYFCGQCTLLLQNPVSYVSERSDESCPIHEEDRASLVSNCILYGRVPE